MTTATTTASQTATDPLALIDVDHVRFYVGNAKQAAYFYAHTFGFNISQVADLTTGSRDEADYLLTQGNIRLLLTTPLTSAHPAAEQTTLYGDALKTSAPTRRAAGRAAEMRHGITNQAALEWPRLTFAMRRKLSSHDWMVGESSSSASATATLALLRPGSSVDRSP